MGIYLLLGMEKRTGIKDSSDRDFIVSVFWSLIAGLVSRCVFIYKDLRC